MESPEVQRVREAIAGYFKKRDKDNGYCLSMESYRKEAETILSNPSILIKAEDQSLPDDPTHTGKCFPDDMQHAFKTGYFASQQDMRKSGFVKEVVKDGKR